MSDETKHTPGPWRVEGEKWQGLVYAVTSEGRGSFVAEAGGDGVAETIANAQLITSAPDLLAALEGILACWGVDLHQEGPESDCPTCRAVAAGRAAIAKAKGGAA